MSRSKVDYDSYLQLPVLLSAQHPESFKSSSTYAHDEMLFVIVHQTYELWFKQILHELDSVLDLFEHSVVDESNMGVLTSRLGRIVEIQKLLIQQVSVLETMTPLDFLEFRDLLYPASGFQSFQFRSLENRLGLRPQARMFYGSGSYKDVLPKEQQDELGKIEGQPSLFECIETWLERTPFLKTPNFDFWDQYQTSVMQSFQVERDMVKQSPLLTAEEKTKSLEMIQNNQNLFEAFLHPDAYEAKRQAGEVRLSHKAAQALLFIQLYRDEPALQLPYQLLTLVMEIDENMTAWRYRHAMMAKRMLGTKMGTGGSSGAKYLQSAADTHKIFNDFFMLTTFLLPRSKRPPLPACLKKSLDFRFSSDAGPTPAR